MKLGHVSMLLSANQLGTIRLEGESGRPFLVKGLVVKDEKKVKEGAPDEKGESDENEVQVVSTSVLGSPTAPTRCWRWVCPGLKCWPSTADSGASVEPGKCRTTR